eukprot:g688.t1
MGASFSRERPVIFLDVDGVLNSEVTRKRIGGDLAKPLIANLRLVVRQTKAHVVLSTTWRLTPQLEERVRHALQAINVTPIGSTPDLEARGQGDRVDEIHAWLKAHERSAPPAYIAIDDLPLCDMGMNERLTGGYIVRTTDKEGLTRAKAEEAVCKIRAQLGRSLAQRTASSRC